MTGLLWHTVRARAGSLVGTFVALGLGVGLLSATLLTLVSSITSRGTEPQWFVSADVVVVGGDRVAGRNVARPSVEPLAVPADLAGRLAAQVDADVVVDYAGPASVVGAPGDSVHPWSASSLHPFAWESGGAPDGDDQVVLTAPTDHAPGDRVTAQTVAGPVELVVSGVISTDALPALYTTDERAAGLADHRIAALALTARDGAVPGLVEQVRRVTTADAVRVLTGDGRRAAEPDPESDLFELAAVLLGYTAGVSAFVSVFVVSSTFAYAVAARRREFGLLRTAGALPRQVRRLVVGEALVVGVLAGAVGSVVGAAVAPRFARWLTDIGFAPEGFTARFVWWPVTVAAGVGILVALLGALFAARRAARVRPVEALREAAVDSRPMTLVRWVVGVCCLVGAVPGLAAVARSDPEDAVNTLMWISIVLVTGFAMLSPVLVGPVVRVLTVPLDRLPGATALLARASTLAAVRRTASTAAPILLAVGLVGGILAGFQTFTRTAQTAAASRVTASTVVVPDGTAGIADVTVAELAQVPGVRAAVPVAGTTVYVKTEASSAADWNGRYVVGPAAATVLDLPVVDGDVADLVGTDTVAVSRGNGEVGQTVSLWLADSALVDLRVVAVLDDQIDTIDTVLLPWDLRGGHTAAPLADEVYLDLAPDADRGRVAAVAAAGGGQVVTTDDHLSFQSAAENRWGILIVVAMLGMALLYTVIALANTLIMATGNRAGELATMRLSGATSRQVVGVVGLEALLVAGVGIGLGGGVTVMTLAGLLPALAASAPQVTVVVPWPYLGGTVVVCLVVAVLSSVVPAALLARRRPVDLAGVRE
ncbi:MAG: ABC transporter permease [Micrococcales bacterium]|nr:ABC transporter permease [Micrococcales bacterium]